MSPAEAVQVPVQPTEALRSGDPVPAELRRALAGQFYNPELDSTYEILVSGDNVLLQFGAWWPIAELLIVGPNRLRLAAYRGGPDIDTELELERDVSGGVTGFSMIRNNLGPTFEFTRK
jgi:hypothetical protein